MPTLPRPKPLLARPELIVLLLCAGCKHVEPPPPSHPIKVDGPRAIARTLVVTQEVQQVVIVEVSLLPYNNFSYGATDTCNSWPEWNTWNATLVFSAPAGVYSVYHNYYVEGYRRDPDHTNFTYGMPWTELNNSPNFSFTNNPSPRGLFTNSTDGLKTITFPIPPWDRQLFKLKQIQ